MQKSIETFFKSAAAAGSKKRSMAAAGIASPSKASPVKVNKPSAVSPKKTKLAENVEEEKKEADTPEKTPVKSSVQTSTDQQQSAAVQSTPATPPEDTLADLESFKASLGTWRGALSSHLDSATFARLFTFVKGEYARQTCYPPKNLIFNAFQQSHFTDLKVVFVGQDPYIKENEAMGMSFSVPRTTKCPPSLQQIYHALANDQDIDFTRPSPLHGDLTRWAQQGVFMLNAILTVRKGASNSHQKQGWEQFSEQVIRTISKDTDGVVFMLWGKKAHEKAKMVDSKKHLVLCNVHPSPLAGTKFRTITDFSKANQFLADKGKTPIDWNL